MASFKELDAWKLARKLVKTVYELSSKFPKEEVFMLTAQIRKAAVSAPSNIAEGVGRRTKKDSLQFQHIARGSLNEIETQVYLAIDLNYLDDASAQAIISEIEDCRKVLSGYIKYLEAGKKT